MASHFSIRHIEPRDIAATLEIYRPFVETTSISFEYEVPSLSEWETRVNTNTSEYPWLICEYNNEIVGYAYGSKHRYRTAYQWSPESTVYLSARFHRLGIAKALYETLFELLKLQGHVNVYAGVTVPNLKSEEFHQALGFYEVAVFKKIGYKFGSWHDTRWFQLHLVDHQLDPPNPLLPKNIRDTLAFNSILETANSKLKNIVFNE